MKYLLLVLLAIPSFLCAQPARPTKNTSPDKQFVLFDVTFTYTKFDADNSKPNKSHYYVTGNMLNTNRPKDWTSPIDYRNGTVHVRLEVLEKPPGNEPTTWSLCYIPNKGQGNGYGCTNTAVYTEAGVYEKDVPMTSFWENESIIWTEGIKQMDLVIKDNSGGQGHAHKRPDHEKFFPTKVRMSMVQVAAGETYDPSWLLSEEEKEVAAQVERLRQVMIKPDKSVLENLAADELSYGHSSGMVENKAQFVDEFVGGHSVFTAITLQDQTVRASGNTAIVRHRLLADTFNKNTPGKIDIIILMVWKKQEGQWKLLARQAAVVPPEYRKN